MKILAAARIFAVVAACSMLSVMAVSCSDNNRDDTPETVAHRVAIDDRITCINLDEDSTGIWAGTPGDAFYHIWPDRGTSVRYELPNPDHELTYCIMQYAPEAFIVCRRNCGATVAVYDSVGRDNISPVVSHIVCAPTAYPHKGSRYSVYNVAMCGDRIVLGSSNGLMYVSRAALDRAVQSRADTLHARYVMPLKPLRDNKLQFSQEALFVSGHLVYTLTDNGLYTISYDKFDSVDARCATHIDAGRYWSGAIVGDTLYALRTSPSRDALFQLCAYPLPLRPGAQAVTRRYGGATAAIVVYGDSLHITGDSDRGLPAGDYDSHNSHLQIGDRFYYLSDSTLMYATTGEPPQKAGTERIAHDMGRYVISDKNAIWRRDAGGFTFMGQIVNPVPIRSATYCEANDSIYIVSKGGIYSTPASRTLLASSRRLSPAYPNNPSDADRFESVHAVGGRLYIGSRGGMRSIDMYTRNVRHYRFDSLACIFESPYVNHIESDLQGLVRINTLNHGVWRLERDDRTLTPLAVPRLTQASGSHGHIIDSQRTLTWERVRDLSGVIALTVCALTGAVTILIYVFRRIRRRLARQLKQARTDGSRALAHRIDAYLAKHEGDPTYEPMTRAMKPLAAALAQFGDTASEDDRKKASSEAYALTRRMIHDVIEPAVSLASDFPDTAPAADEPLLNELGALMAGFKKDITERCSPGIDPQTAMATACDIYRSYLDFSTKLMHILQRLRREASPVGKVYDTGRLDMLWKAVKMLDVGHVIDEFNIYDKYFFEVNGLRIQQYCYRITFVTLMFFNDAVPSIKGIDRNDMRYISRSVYNFNPRHDKRGYNNHGNAYKVVVQAMSPNHALTPPEKRPIVEPHIANIIWNRCLSLSHEHIHPFRHKDGSEKSLSSAIIIATELEDNDAR